MDPKGNNVAAKHIYLGHKHPLPNIVGYNEKLKQLNHHNIVKVSDIHQEENMVWMFMELCKLGDLNTFYKRCKVTNQQCLAIMTQIVAGVKCCTEIMWFIIFCLKCLRLCIKSCTKSVIFFLKYRLLLVPLSNQEPKMTKDGWPPLM